VQALRDNFSGEIPEAETGRASPLYRRIVLILAAEIRDAILPVGSRLTEPDLARRFGVSRAPVRQALALLGRHGLVTRAGPRRHVIADDAADRASLVAPTASSLAPSRLESLPSWRPIYDEVESEIIARIAFGSWRLREADLARHFRVSRTVARDVIGRLQGRGLVEKDEAGRWQAPELTAARMTEHYELRWVLEPLALRKAAPRIPPEAVQMARRRLQAAVDRPESVTGEMLDGLEEDLHVSLLAYGDNLTLLRSVRQHQSLLVAHRFLYRWTHRLFATEPFLPEHMAILDRLTAGDHDGAATALEHHLRQSLDRAVARVREVNVNIQPDELGYLERP
jgi:DNA-binding GntR family transcriptional regulator